MVQWKVIFARSLALLSISLVTSSAMASDPVTDAIQQAYAPYRAALFHTNAKQQVDSEKALTLARQQWSELISRFAGNPPAPYDRDSVFATSMAQVNGIYEKAEREARASNFAQAHETLEQVREIIAELRRRNQVTSFSDQMNAYHAEMEHMLTDGPRKLVDPDGMLQLLGQVGVLEYLARRLFTEAPTSLANEGDFVTLAKAVEKSVAELKSALLAQDGKLAKEAMSKLKGPYGRMFLRYG